MKVTIAIPQPIIDQVNRIVASARDECVELLRKAVADALEPALSSPGRKSKVQRKAAKRAAVPIKNVTATPTAATPKKRINADKVFETATSGPAKNAQEIADALGVPYATAYFHLKQLADSGRLVVGADKKYRRVVAQN